MFCMASYSLGHIGSLLGGLLQKVTRRYYVLDKAVSGTTDAAQWSRMIHGACSLDLNRLYHELDSHTLAQYFGAVLAQKISDEQKAIKQEVA